MTPSAAWEPEHHKVLVDLCVEQTMLGNQPSMRQILEPLLERTGVRFTKGELKYHCHTMIKEWKIWCRLVQSRDMKWDPQTNTFGASDQEWANYLQVNPEAEQYRCSPPLFLKKLEIIFARMNLDGEGTSGCSQRKQRSEDEATLSAANIKTRRHWTKWSPSTHALLVDLCFEEYLKGNKTTRCNGTYPKQTWKMMLEKINQMTGVGYTQEQLRNHFDYTRRNWKHWCQTISSPIMKWDANTKMFGATKEDWNNYLKENKNAAQFKRKPIPHADKLACIFKGYIESGKAKSRRSQKRVIDHHSQSPNLHEPAAPSSAVCTNKPVTGSDNRAEEKILVDGSVKKKEYTIGECIECLDAMEEVEKGCDLYMFAVDLFLKRECRNVFLMLKTSRARISWLRRRFSG